MKAIFNRINWFLESLYAEFIEWAKILLIGIGGILLAVLMWQIEGLTGKAIVTFAVIFIVGGAIAKTHSKYLNDKLEKMSSAQNLPKKEITDSSFLELYSRIVMELRELEDEIRKTGMDYMDTLVPIQVLEAIRSESGDIISFASGLVAKADAEIKALIDKQPVLPGFDK